MVWDVGDVHSMVKDTIKVLIIVGLVVEASIEVGSMLKEATSGKVDANFAGKKDVGKEDCVFDNLV